MVLGGPTHPALRANKTVSRCVRASCWRHSRGHFAPLFSFECDGDAPTPRAPLGPRRPAQRGAGGRRAAVRAPRQRDRLDAGAAALRSGIVGASLRAARLPDAEAALRAAGARLARPTAEQHSHRRTAKRCDAQSPPQATARCRLPTLATRLARTLRARCWLLPCLTRQDCAHGRDLDATLRLRAATLSRRSTSAVWRRRLARVEAPPLFGAAGSLS